MLNLSKILKAIKPYVLGWIYEESTYTPLWTAATTDPAIGNGTLTGQYVKRGKHCLVNIVMIAGSTTTFGSGNWFFSFPFPASDDYDSFLGWIYARNAGVANYHRLIQLVGGSIATPYFLSLDAGSNVNNFSSSVPFAWGNGDSVRIQIEYVIGGNVKVEVSDAVSVGESVTVNLP